MKIKSKSMRKKSAAVLAGLAIAGAVGASAASLGGLNSDELGADTGAVASCDIDGIDVAYTTEFDETEGEYLVTEIVLSDVDEACDTQDVDLTVLRTNFEVTPNEVLTSLPFTAVADDTESITVDTSRNTVTAESITGLAISISGVPVAP